MIINLSGFLQGSEDFLNFKGELKETESDLSELGIKIVEPIKYEGEIFKVDGENTIEMRVVFKYEEACSRCLTLSNYKVNTTLVGKLVEGKEETDRDADGEGYDDIIYYENDSLNPKDYILNQVILSLPMKSLCSENCKGLCSSCGIDMNKNTCDCIKEDIDPRFEKLKDFFPKK